MKDYSNYYQHSSDRLLHNAQIMFEKQLLTNEARDAIIDNIPERVLLRNHTNEMKEGQEDRFLYTKLDSVAKLGSKVDIEEIPNRKDRYIIMTDLDYHYSYLKCKMRKTNHVLKFWTPYGKLVEEDCLFDGATLWNTGVLNTTFSPFPTGSAKSNAIFQHNDDTKYLDKDIRFIANRTAYKITAMNIDKDGLITVVCEETQVKEGLDDLENEIPYNPYKTTVIIPVQENIKMSLSETIQIESKILKDFKEIQGTILYASSNEDVVQVTELGVLKPLKLGNSTITLTLKENPNITAIVNCNVENEIIDNFSIELLSDEKQGYIIEESSTTMFTPKMFNNGNEINSDWEFEITYSNIPQSRIEVKEKTSKYIKIKALGYTGSFKLKCTNILNKSFIEQDIILKRMWM